jgi:hypothetical protein
MVGVSTIVGDMPKYERIPGSALSLITNSPSAPTGYGVQAQLLVDRMMRHGMNVAVQSNYGLEGSFDRIKTKHGYVDHYPKGYKPYSDDVIPIWAEDFKAKHPQAKHALMTLYDVWVYDKLEYDGDIIAYVPLDHITIPPLVRKFLERPNVIPVAMSLHGQRLMNDRGIKNHYAPHAFDKNVYKPTYEVQGVPTRQFMGVDDDDFLISIVFANKSNRILHRKAIDVQLSAINLWRTQMKPDRKVKIYLHTEPTPVFGGFDIPRLMEAIGIPVDDVIFPDAQRMRVGYPPEELAAFYTASDLVMNATMGEGFGVTNIESQACGAKLLTSNWTASMDLGGPDSYLCDGEPFWNESQGAWWMRPSLASLASGIQLAFEAERGISEANIEWVQQYEADYVWDTHWMPFFKEYYGTD